MLNDFTNNSQSASNEWQLNLPAYEREGSTGTATQPAVLLKAKADPFTLLKRLDQSEDDYFEPAADMAVKPDTSQPESEKASLDNQPTDEKPVRVTGRASLTRTRRKKNQSENSQPTNTPTPRRR